MGVVSRQIGWSQESNLLWQILKQLNRLTSVMFALKPKYKVFEALVIQNGTDSPNSITGGDLIIGVSYQIKDLGGSIGFDFTNVGAPNNDFFTFFIATGTTPNSWGVPGFEAQLFYNDAAPTVIILEDTIKGIGFEYRGPGSYKINSDNKFIAGKTTAFVTTNVKNYPPTDYQVILQITEAEQPTSLELFTGRVTAGLEDSVIQTGQPATVRIKVYN